MEISLKKSCAKNINEFQAKIPPLSIIKKTIQKATSSDYKGATQR